MNVNAYNNKIIKINLFFFNLIICFTIYINKRTLSLISPNIHNRYFIWDKNGYTHPFTNTMLHTFFLN